MSIESEQEALSKLSLDELREIRSDGRKPKEVREAAKALETQLSDLALLKSWKAFTAGTPEFTQLTQQLLTIVKNTPPSTADKTVAKINEVLLKVSDIGTKAIGIAFDPERSKAEEPSAAAAPAGTAAPTTAAAPAAPPSPPSPTAAPSSAAGTPVSSAKDFASLKDEYVRMFDTAAIDPARAAEVKKIAGLLVAHKQDYEDAGKPLGVPWYVVAVIHAMEGLSFGRHLHNGDPLSARTVQVPKGRPKSGEPPFAWTVSAADALTFEKFDKVGSGNWSLGRTLFQLEGYNGFGYRPRQQATPYLWSYCQHYGIGKYVGDGEYSPTAKSKQCGAAVLLKQLENDGQIQIPR